MLNATNAFECSVHHDCNAAAQSFTFFHATLHHIHSQRSLTDMEGKGCKGGNYHEVAEST